jgi:hypothetical protein
VFGETVLIDWGLSRRFDENDARREMADERPVGDPASAVLMSNAGGTIGFMSPEQTAQASQVGPPADIYSLGATLYYLLTAQAPFPYPTTPQEGEAAMQQIRNGEFPLPRKLNPNVHPDLEAICRKAMALEPPDRYAGASDLATDVDRWLAGEPISARREPRLRRCWRLAKRYRGVTAAIAAAVLMFLVVSAATTPFLRAAYTREKDQRTRAEAQRARANSNLKTSLSVMDLFLDRARADPKPSASSVAELRNFYLPRLIHFYEQLVAVQDDQSPEARQLVGRAYHGLGVCYTLQGDRRRGETHFLSAQAIQEQLTGEIADPEQLVPYAADLAVTRIDLAQLYRDWGRPQDEAKVRQQIADAYDAFADRKHAYRFAFGVAQRFRELGQFPESNAWLGKVIDALEELLRNHPDQPDARTALAESLSARALYWFAENRYDLALKDWERRSQVSAAPLPPDVRVFYAGSLARQGEHVKAAAEAEALSGTTKLDSANMYNLACALAISVSAARQDRHLSLTERKACAERYAKDALTWLRKSHAAGFFQLAGAVEQLKKDADFDSLRTREDFKQFLAEVEKKK